MIENYSQVQLVTDKYEHYGISRNSIGYVIETYDTGDYEIEFSREDGSTIAQFAVRPNEVEMVEKEVEL